MKQQEQLFRMIKLTIIILLIMSAISLIGCATNSNYDQSNNYITNIESNKVSFAGFYIDESGFGWKVYWFKKTFLKIGYDKKNSYVSCFKRYMPHFNFTVTDVETGQLKTDYHTNFWQDGNDLFFGIYNSGKKKRCYVKKVLSFPDIKNFFQSTMIEEGIPYSYASTMSTICAYTIVVKYAPAFAIVLAPKSSDQNVIQSDKADTKTIIYSSLSAYYNSQGKKLPDISTRGEFFEALDIGFANEYKGTAEQNAILLEVLSDLEITPTSTKELTDYLNTIYPAPTACESGIADTYRTTNDSWSYTWCYNRAIAIHIGRFDRKLYIGVCDENGRWGGFTDVPNCASNFAPAIAYWQGKVVISFTASDGTMWVGTYDANLKNFSGWHSTNRQSLDGPVLASDGKNIFLVYLGLDQKIYFSENIGNWFNNDWKCTNRTSTVKPGACVYNGMLAIVHKGEVSDEIYLKVDANHSPDQNWISIGRQTHSSPTIFFFGGKFWIGQQGLNDGRNYIGNLTDNNWITLPEVAMCAPYINRYKNKIGYAYVNNHGMRFINFDPWKFNEPCASEVINSGRTTQNSITADANIRMHTGDNDNKIYFSLSGNDFGTIWNEMPNCGTSAAPSTAICNNQRYYAFLGGDGKIWIGKSNLDGSNWSGWYDTYRTSWNSPVLVSDGNNRMCLIQLGAENYTIYYSDDVNNWFRNKWQDTGRTSKTTPNGIFVNGQFIIFHIGFGDWVIYYCNITNHGPWIGTNRTSLCQPAIVTINGVTCYGYSGEKDFKNYITRLDNNKTIILKDHTSCAPAMIIKNNMIYYFYVSGNSMRLQKVNPF